jgi:phosphoribosylglycinamide formyltransferase 1
MVHTHESEVRLAMLGTGSGSTIQAIGLQCKEGSLRGRIKPIVVISSKEDAGCLKKAQMLEIPTEVVARKDYPKGDKGIKPYGEALLNVLRRYEPDFVTMNGFLPQISLEVILEYLGRMSNQHPGPRELGGKGMYGRRVHAAAIIYNRLARIDPPWTEVIAQRVDPNYDRGAVIKSARVTILKNDTVDSLQEHAIRQEHAVQVAMLEDVANDNVTEVQRAEQFVQPFSLRQHVILYVAREVGKVLYPQG